MEIGAIGIALLLLILFVYSVHPYITRRHTGGYVDTLILGQLADMLLDDVSELVKAGIIPEDQESLWLERLAKGTPIPDLKNRKLPTTYGVIHLPAAHPPTETSV